MSKNLPSQPILGLMDGIEVLQFLASSDHELSGVEIARELNIEKTKINRILKTLSFLGFTAITSNRKYTLGPAIHVLSAQLLHGSGLIKNALKYLIELTRLNLVVAMGVIWRDKVAYTYHWQPGISPSDGLGRTNLFPVYDSSIGIILCAQEDEEGLNRILKFGANDIDNKTKDEFLNKVRIAKEQGYASILFKNRKSIAVKIGNPAYAAIALAQCNPNISDECYLKILQRKVREIEAVGPTYNTI